MSTANDILGKIGEKVGSEFSNLRVSLSTNYATKVSLGNVVNTIDFSPYSTKVSLNGVITSLGNARVSLGGRLTTLENAGYATTSDVDLKASKVSINNLRNGTDIFSVLSATRAEIGDLNVTGTTTTINTQTLNVKDNIIEVNLKSDGSENAQTSGIQVNRGEAVVSVTENLGNGITDFVAIPNQGYLNTLSWKQDGNTTTYNTGNSMPTGSEVDSHIGKLQDGGNYIETGVGEYLVFDFDSNGNLISIDTFTPTSGGSNVRRIIGFSHVGGVEDKATIIWDDNTGQSMWKFGLGSSDADIKVKDILVSGSVKVPNSSGIKINNVDLGDYSTFETAFLAEL